MKFGFTKTVNSPALRKWRSSRSSLTLIITHGLRTLAIDNATLIPSFTALTTDSSAAQSMQSTDIIAKVSNLIDIIIKKRGNNRYIPTKFQNCVFMQSFDYECISGKY